MKALLRWLDQWARNIALQRENSVLRDELEEALYMTVGRTPIWH